LTDTPYNLPNSAPSRQHLALLTLGVEGGMLTIGLLLCWLVGPNLLGNLSLSPMALLQGALWGLLMLAVVVLIIDHPASPFAGLQEDMGQLRTLFQNAKPVDVVFMSVMAGLGEEVLFRGFLLHHGSEWLGIPAGLALSSLLFGLVHAISFAYVAFASLLGFALGLLYLWSGTLLVPIVAHGVYDVAALWYLLRLRRETPEPKA